MKQKQKKTGTGPLHTLVCVTCGNQQFFTAEVPSVLHCDSCGGSVFRNFDTPTRSDEASISQLEDTARSASLGDSSPDTTRDDLRDLDR